MKIELELWHLILLLIAFFGSLGWFGKILLDQIEKRLGERFAGQEKQRAEDQKHWDAKFAALEAAAKKETDNWSNIQRELLELKADLPTLYVRREDYVQRQTVLELKIDRVFTELQELQKQGGK